MKSERLLIDIPNWEKWQRDHKGNVRKAPLQWMKLNGQLLHDPEFMSLTIEQRWLWIAVLLHASCVGVPFKLSPSDARVLFKLRRSADFSPLIEQGLITVDTLQPSLAKPKAEPRREKKARERAGVSDPREAWGPAPEGVDPTAWGEWADYKRGRPVKATITQTANFLSAYPPDQQQHIVRQSVRNTWKGLFPPKDGKRSTSDRNQDAMREYLGETH